MHVTSTPRETEALGEKTAAAVRGGTVIALQGGLGAGKTTFCRGLARGLGCTDEVSSPTYAIVNLYRGRVPLAHMDAWRITSADDLEAAGYYDFLDQGAVVAIEWSEKVAAFLPPNHVTVAIVDMEGGKRGITITGLEGAGL